MIRLRDQLQSSKNAYTTVRYPGDLAAEVAVSPDSSSRRHIWLAGVGFGAGALAAAVALVIFLSRPMPRPLEHRSGPIEGPRETVAIAPKETPGLPLAPPAMPEMPAMPDLWAMPAMPTMPAGLTGVTPPSAPSHAPDIMPLAPPGGLIGFPPTMASPFSNGASTKEPA